MFQICYLNPRNSNSFLVDLVIQADTFRICLDLYSLLFEIWNSRVKDKRKKKNLISSQFQERFEIWDISDFLSTPQQLDLAQCQGFKLFPKPHC